MSAERKIVGVSLGGIADVLVGSSVSGIGISLVGKSIEIQDSRNAEIAYSSGDNRAGDANMARASAASAFGDLGLTVALAAAGVAFALKGRNRSLSKPSVEQPQISSK